MKSFYVFLCFVIVTANSQLIVPKPSLDVELISEYSIAINWTMPINENYDGFKVSIQPPTGIEVEEDDPRNLRRQFDNLVPGILYTFIVQASRGDELSDPVVILQDTVPLPPTDLQLNYFDELVLALGGSFGDTEFTLEMAGVEAIWKDPKHGVCECYLAVISPDDGIQAIPGEKDEVVVGTRMRQFIHLTPGETYTIKVHSSTCGEGHRGALRSDPIMADITLPPADPPAIVVEEVTPTTAHLSWEEPPIPGLYDDFEVITVEEPDVIVNTPTLPTDPRRTVSNLSPCKPYEYQVYTLYRGMRSKNARKAIVFTKPFPPQSLVVSEYTMSSITLKWEAAKSKMIYFEGYEVEYSSADVDKGYNARNTKDKEMTLTDLEPGSTYSLSVASVCRNEQRLISIPVYARQTTKPEAPLFSNHECEMVNPPESEFTKKDSNDPYLSVPWASPKASTITLNWSKPNRGSWDGFVIDYSPFEFEQGVATPAAPLVVDVPIAGTLFTASIRAISDGATSEAMVSDVHCPDEDGEAKRRCKSSLDFWDITITPIENNTMLLIQIPDYPFYNATVFANGPVPTTSIYHEGEFTIPNPCAANRVYTGSQVTVYPICPPELPFCPIIRRNLCVFMARGQSEGITNVVPKDACCNSRAYNTMESVCCHGRLLERKQMTGFEECCISRWYARNSQRCCPPGRVPGSPGLVLPGRVKCPEI